MEGGDGAALGAGPGVRAIGVVVVEHAPSTAALAPVASQDSQRLIIHPHGPPSAPLAAFATHGDAWMYARAVRNGIELGDYPRPHVLAKAATAARSVIDRASVETNPPPKFEANREDLTKAASTGSARSVANSVVS